MRTSRCLLVGLLACGALAFAAPVAAQSVKAGIEAWQRGDVSRAVAIWRPLAEAGDADAAFNLGQAYRLGRGVPTNLAAARTWLERAARKDHLDAMTTLGLLLFDNGDSAAGLPWLGRAAERGEPRALLIYGTALFNGDGVERDPVLAYAYVSRAAAQGLAPAKQTLAEMDQLLPLEERKEGVALAVEKASEAAPAPPKARAIATPAPPKARAKPAPPPAPKAPAASAASGPWRIQLGAFSKRASAQALYNRLSGTAALAGRKPFLVAAGSIVRLQVGPFATRSAAEAACRALSANGQACFPVSSN